MRLIGVPTGMLKSGDDLAGRISKKEIIMPGDIVVISSKAAATIEGAAVDLSRIKISPDAKLWSERTGRSPAFCQATLEEMKRLNGKIVGHVKGALLTEMRPEGLPRGTILTANAGMDESNVEDGSAIGWPTDILKSARALRKGLGLGLGVGRTGENRTAVIISDTCCAPRRQGVTAFALVASGIDPIRSLIGEKDLFGKTMKITTEAIADQFATAANIVMGNAGQGIPAVIIRDHGLALSDFEGWVPGIEPEEDLFREILP